MEDKVFIYTHSKNNIDYYKVNPNVELYADAIDIETGKVEPKRVLGYTIHRNLDMYKITDTKNRFKPFWVSEDHSLIVYDNEQRRLLKASPLDVLACPERFNLVQKAGDNVRYIPCTEVTIEYDPSKTCAADLTVEDYTTFATDDGIFVQDTMAVYRPLTKAAIQECEEKLWTIKNVYSAANATIQFEARQAILYGLYKMSATKKGRQLLSKLLGTNIEKQIDKKYLSELVDKLYKQYGWKVLDKIKTLGLSTTLQSPETLSILDLEPKKLELTGNREQDNDIIAKFTDEIKESFPKAGLIKSGSRGNWDQVRQMIGARGYVSDFWGNIVPIPVKSCYAEGLDPEDFFISCYGCRKAILDVAENTAKSGFLTRKMVYATVSCELDYNLKDCGTDVCVSLHVEDMDLARALWGRYYYEDVDGEMGVELKCVERPEDILGKHIYLRSPMFCRGTRICRTCYGRLADIHKSRFIGIIAAQTLGERSTQLVLRTFHTGGVAKGKEKQEDIVSSMENAIQNLDKTITVEDYQDVVQHTLDLFNLFKEHGFIHLVHFEILTSQRLWAELPDKIVRVRTNLDELEKLEQVDTEGWVVDLGYSLKLFALSVIPSLESWFLGMAFQNARANFVKGYLYPTKKKNILERLILGEL